MSALPELVGGRLQRIDGPRPTLFAIEVRRPGETGVLILSLGDPVEWGWVDARPRGDPASAFVGQLRKHLTNARVTEATTHAAGATLELIRAETRAALHLVRRPANLVLVVEGVVVGALDARALRESGAARGTPWPPPPAGPPEIASTFEALVERGPDLVERATREAIADRRGPLAKALRRHAAKLRRRLRAIEADLDRVDEVAGTRGKADLLLAHLRTIPEGAREARLSDWETGAEVVIPIADGRGPREEAEALYRRARKLERGGQIAIDRHALTEEELGRTADLVERVSAAPEAALDGLESEAARLGVVPARAARRGEAEARVPYRTFLGTGDRPILVGRSARDNDRLTTSARAWDAWLHARGVRGSHVVVPLSKGETCPDALLLDAAHLAAHFSAARSETTVEVQHASRRHVRKPKGMAAGAVLVDRERVVVLRVEPDRLARLLAAETRETRTPR